MKEGPRRAKEVWQMDYGFDSNSFILDGKRVWLYAGEIHYFRFVRSEWRRALELAKAAGLNAVSTYVAWNRHEPRPGEWDFQGDNDLAEFLDTAAELGLYVMLRPGPYICGEWTGGGIPAWLLTEPQLEQRVDEPVFMAHTERWLRKVMEIAAPRQVTRGGNIIAIQNDNEYHGGWDARTSAYIEKVTGILRDAGCEVAITACNCHVKAGHMMINYDADMYDRDIYRRLNMIVTFNTCSDFGVIDELRAYQPSKPALLTELWTGPMVFWQQPVSDGMPDQDVARWIVECTLRGAMVTMYMFIGGTNFGFNAASNLATSYSSAYPVGDALRPRNKYYALKPFGGFLSCYGTQLAGARREQLEAQGARAARFDTERGGIVVMAGDDAHARVELGGAQREICFGDVRGGALADGLRAAGGTLDWANLFVLGECGGALLLYGPAGEDYALSANGELRQGVVRARPELIEVGGMKLVVLDERSARHTWLLGDEAVLGGAFARAGADGPQIEPGEFERVYLLRQGALTERAFDRARVPAELPALVRWEKRDPFEGVKYAPLAEPRFHEQLGALNGYVLYRGTITSPCARSGLMTAACAATRVLVMVNGEFAGELGERRTENERFDYANPADRLRERVGIQLRAGVNEILLLSEDAGRCCLDSMPLGIQGNVYVDSRMINLDDAVYVGATELSAPALDYLYSPALTSARPVDTLKFGFELSAGERLILIVHDAPCWVETRHGAAPHVQQVRRPWQSFGYRDGGSHLWHCYLPQCDEGHNELTIQCPGDARAVLAHAQAYVVKESDRIGDWSWAALPEQVPYAGRADYESAGGAQSKLLAPFARIGVQSQHRPAWYTTTFARPDAPDGLFITLGAMRKGQIYLNGHNVGRFQRCPAQRRYYLPAEWLCADNRLSIFEEYGIAPDGVRLER